MTPRILAAFLTGLLATLLASAAKAPDPATQWQDTNGVTFTGQPVEVSGPFALFTTGKNTGRRLLLRQLPDAEAIRFAQETAHVLPRAGSIAEAQSPIAKELALGARVPTKEKKFAPADLRLRPEPEVYVVLYSHQNWGLPDTLKAVYQRLRTAWPNSVEFIHFDLDPDIEHVRHLITTVGVPWLIADTTIRKKLPLLAGFAPSTNTTLLVALSRHGAPLLVAPGNSTAQRQQFIDDLTTYLRLIDPENPAGWTDRLHFYNTVRPVLHASDSAPPLLIGTPLRREALKRKEVKSLFARVQVGTNGRPTDVELAPDGVPEPLRTPVADGIKRGAVFCPAIAQGQAVSGSYDFVVDLPRGPTCTPEERAWLQGEFKKNIPLDTWHILRPVSVDQNAFTTVVRVDPNGLNILSPFEVSQGKVSKSRELDSFRFDWFSEEGGADSVRPVDGAVQRVGEQKLRWIKTELDAGYLNLKGELANADFVIGYAWIEFEVPQATEALLALGSDEGVRLWHNGAMVHDRWIKRACRIDDDIVPLHLVAGKNRLLLKVQNSKSNWGFVCRLRTR